MAGTSFLTRSRPRKGVTQHVRRGASLLDSLLGACIPTDPWTLAELAFTPTTFYEVTLLNTLISASACCTTLCARAKMGCVQSINHAWSPRPIRGLLIHVRFSLPRSGNRDCSAPYPISRCTVQGGTTPCRGFLGLAACYESCRGSTTLFVVVRSWSGPGSPGTSRLGQ